MILTRNSSIKNNLLLEELSIKEIIRLRTEQKLNISISEEIKNHFPSTLTLKVKNLLNKQLFLLTKEVHSNFLIKLI